MTEPTKPTRRSAVGPVCLVDYEVGGPVPEPQPHTSDGRPYARAAVAVRVHGELIGIYDMPIDGPPDGATLARFATAALQQRIDEHLQADGLRPGMLRNGSPPRCLRDHARFLEHAPFVSVIIATRDGEATLGDCLDSLLALEYSAFEVIVVDNASRGDGVRELVARYGDERVPIRYVREERPGLAVAHNCGLEHAAGAIVAFIDDDVIADRRWLAQVGKAFEAAPDVGCVTGLIAPAELESRAQLLTEGYWGFGKGFERRVYDRRKPPGQPLYPFTAGVFGSGANMSFRADALRELGGFDPGLGTGSPAQGGDDLAAFFGIIEAGHRLVYEPTAMVRHRHRREYEALERQAYGYGVGLTAYLAKTLMDDPRRTMRLALRAPQALAHILHPSSPKNATLPEDVPVELQRRERRGMLVGAFIYARTRRSRQRLYPRLDAIG